MVKRNAVPRIFFYARRLSTIAGTRPKYTRQDLRRVRGINGEQRQDWNTNDMIFNCRQLITFASRMMTIKPGDILFTGTPHGVARSRSEASRP